MAQTRYFTAKCNILGHFDPWHSWSWGIPTPAPVGVGPACPLHGGLEQEFSALVPHLPVSALTTPPKLEDIWGPFHRSDNKPNGSRNRATHWRCINSERPSSAPINIELATGV
ncbi:hypothetical protein B0H19DRAFT_1085188 [Mycena capillaripes]|nr:hypothetical protein B0H19DRAFT_1085188 [Mycena capillaripes]